MANSDDTKRAQFGPDTFASVGIFLIGSHPLVRKMLQIPSADELRAIAEGDEVKLVPILVTINEDGSEMKWARDFRGWIWARVTASLEADPSQSVVERTWNARVTSDMPRGAPMCSGAHICVSPGQIFAIRSTARNARDTP